MGKRSQVHGYDTARVQREGYLRLLISGLLSLLVVGLVFWAVFWLFPHTARLPKTTSLGGAARPVEWSLLSGVVSVATLSLVVGGLVFTVSEYVQNAVQRRREAAQAEFAMYREVFDRFMSQEAMAARRWIILNLPTLDQAGNDVEAWLARTKALISTCPDEEKAGRTSGREYVKQTLNTFDFLGFVARNYWSMENELVEWMSGPIAKVWERIYLYVERQAAERAEPDFYLSARWLGQRCMEWRSEQKYPKSNIIQDAT